MLSDTLLLLLISAVANAQIEIQTGKYRVSEKKSVFEQSTASRKLIFTYLRLYICIIGVQNFIVQNLIDSRYWQYNFPIKPL